VLILPTKDPSEVLNYTIDWSDRLGSDTLTGTPTVTVTGAVKDSQSNTANSVTVKLSGGTAGIIAKIEVRGVTTAGLTIEDTAVLMIGFDAVTLAEAKAAQKIETTVEDALLTAFLRGAVGAVERATGKFLSPRIVAQTIDGFDACDRAIRLWNGPVTEILSIAYDDSDGVEQELTSFRLVEGASARLLPAYGETWPVTASGPGTVRVSYAAGYAVGELPGELWQAAILLFGHFNQNREAVNIGNITSELPLGVEMMIRPYRPCGLA
jgi:uncharacterized phiE125 gp8 family phage protein